MTALEVQHRLCRSYGECSLVPVDKDQLDEIAKHLTAAYLDTAVYRQQFMKDHGSPPSLMAKIHNMRATVQAALAHDDCYELRAPYAEYGRVQFVEVSTGTEFLLRSAAAVKIEELKFEQLELNTGLTVANSSGVRLLVYSFTKEGVSLSVTGTIQRNGRRRLEAAGPPTLVGVWPYLPADGSSPFDQNEVDAFGDLGDLGEEGDIGEDA